MAGYKAVVPGRFPVLLTRTDPVSVIYVFIYSGFLSSPAAMLALSLYVPVCESVPVPVPVCESVPVPVPVPVCESVPVPVPVCESVPAPVPVPVECFESRSLPAELRSLFHRLSVLLPLPELSRYQRWRQKTSSGGPRGSEQLDFEDLVHYLQDYEKDLKLLVTGLDGRNAGCVDPLDLVRSLRDLGMQISPELACKALRSMDQNGLITISSGDWSESPEDQEDHQIILYWKHSTVFDIGDNLKVPEDFTVEERRTGMWWRHLVAGGGAGAVSRTCTAPLDRLKIMMQVYGSRTNNLCIVTGLMQMIKEGGVKSLWRGNGINVIKIVPESAIKFMAYEQIKVLLGSENQNLSIFERFVAGSMAGVTAQSAIYPLEVLKTRLAVGSTSSAVWDCVRQMWKWAGPAGFYRGFLPNLLGIVPYAGIDLAVYETLRNAYRPSDSAHPGVLVLLTCGTVSSTCGQLASYPLALIRTRMQAQALLEPRPPPARMEPRPPPSRMEPRPPPSMTGLFREVLRSEGPAGLYRGLAPNFLKVVPAVSISYVVYEHLKTSLGVASR